MNINYLNFDIVSPFGTNIFLGRRKSGKTTAAFTFLYQFRNIFNAGVVFCGSVATSMQYSQVIPGSFIYSSLDSKVIQKIINRQQSKLIDGTIKPMVVLIDDCGFDSKKLNSKVMANLFQNGRHYRLCIIVCLQYCKSIGPRLRSNCDFVFAAREKNPMYRKMLFEQFNIGFDDFKTFDDVYKATTTNYDLMVLACALPTQSDRAQDNMFFWKAIFPLPKFKINPNGNWWKLHEQKTAPQKGERSMMHNVVKLGRRTEKKEVVKESNEVFVPKLKKRKSRFF